MSNSLDNALSQTALKQAWLRLWSKTKTKSKSTHGVDGISLIDFEDGADAKLVTIRRKIVKGEFHFSPLRPLFIKKNNGKFRVICVPTTQDRIVQGALLAFLQTHYNKRFANKISYGFVQGRSVQQALLTARSLRAHSPWVFKTDISAFFDRIPRNTLIERIQKHIREKSLHPLLEKVVELEIYADSATTSKRLNQLGIEEGRGVRQGMPLSPFLSNLILENFDKKVTQKGLNAVRYADDLIFFGTSKDACEKIYAFCEAALAEVALEIPSLKVPKSKTAIYSPQESAEFLGAELTAAQGGYSIIIPKGRLDKIKEDFLSLGSVQALNSRNISIGKLSKVLADKKAGLLSAYDACENINSLEDMLDDVEQRLLEKIYSEDLKIDLSKISGEAKTFLGLRV